MGAPMVYIIEVRVPGEPAVRLVEIPAPSFHTAVMMLASWQPGIHVIKLHGSYIEGSKGFA